MRLTALAALLGEADALHKAPILASSSAVVPTYGSSANGFRTPPRGWNSWGLEANKFIPRGDDFSETNIRKHCGALRGKYGVGKEDIYCSIDSGWSGGCNGDEYGRIIANSRFSNSLTKLASDLRADGVKLGVYILPGAFS